MPEITDMVLTLTDLVRPDGPVVEVAPVDEDGRVEVLEFVAAEHEPFLRYYRDAGVATEVCAVREGGDVVAAVLVEHRPELGTSERDAGLGCLVVARCHRGRGLASAALAEVARLLWAQGYERVIAEWVWSTAAYARLGFVVLRTRPQPQ